MAVRFLFRVLGNLLFILGLSIILFAYVPIVYSEVLYRIGTISERDRVVVDEYVDDGVEFENIIPIIPVNKKFAVIITKINVNAPVVKNVTTVSKFEYTNALRSGVAHAKGTALPGESGNMFLFAHSSVNFWQLGPYATVFNLLRKLEKGDTITFYYEAKPYIYKVFDKEIVAGWNTEPFDEEYDEPVVTLVTCDPPGSTINRLVIKARML